MNFELERSIQILERTPHIIHNLLNGLSDFWTHQNEGNDSWSPYDIVGHLIHGEKTDWIPRLEIILGSRENKTFKPFDRFAQFEASKGKSLEMLLDEFAKVRVANLTSLKDNALSEADLNKTGVHPEFGTVTARQLLSTWVVHDLGHIAQITRVMAKQYKEDVGPWKAYIPILGD